MCGELVLIKGGGKPKGLDLVASWDITIEVIVPLSVLIAKVKPDKGSVAVLVVAFIDLLWHVIKLVAIPIRLLVDSKSN
jgi:hypothetical protein